MATVSTAQGESTRPWRHVDFAGWLGLAAAPTFALMGIITATGASPAAFCTMGSRGLPIDAMTAMYLLMSLFHLPPWLRFVRRSRRTQSPRTKGDRT